MNHTAKHKALYETAPKMLEVLESLVRNQMHTPYCKSRCGHICEVRIDESKCDCFMRSVNAVIALAKGEYVA